MQTPRNLVGSLLRQFATQLSSFPQALLDLYQDFKEDEASISMTELLLVLKHICEHFEKCFVIIDALDKCLVTYRREVLHILSELSGEWVQLFGTSRPHSHDIKQHFNGTEQVAIAANETDIQSYCLQKIDSNDSTHELMDNELRVEVANSIAKNAQGMYVELLDLTDSILAFTTSLCTTVML